MTHPVADLVARYYAAFNRHYEIPTCAFFSVQEGLIARVSNDDYLPLWLAQIRQTS
jgi:hypothetical protein